MDIYLLRHGETDWNREGLLQGHTDIPLNESGRKQVYDTVQKLASTGVKIDLIVSSPLQRARESAEIATGQLEYPPENIVVEPMLTERGFGAGEGMTLAERDQKFPDKNYPGMEPQTDLIKRAGTLFEKIVDTYIESENISNILLVAHGAVLYALLAAISKEKIFDLETAAALTQGSIYRIRYLNNEIGFAVYDEGEKGFLDADAGMIGGLVKIYM